jgi:hypothetical protein
MLDATHPIAEFNRKFTVPAAQKGSALVRLRRKDLDWIFRVLHERTVNQDNIISLDNRLFQPEKTAGGTLWPDKLWSCTNTWTDECRFAMDHMSSNSTQ